MELSICSRVVVPDSMATGMFRKVNTITRINPVPVRASGLELKPRM